MKIAIMQPYLFPYIGYWQLIDAVDKFVILDDVNYIMRGYINRNSILVNGAPHRFSVPLKKASQNRLIKDTQLNFNLEEKNKFLMTIQNSYKKCEYYENIMPMLEKIILNNEEDLTSYIEYSIRSITNYLQISTEIIKSSDIKKDESLKAQDRIIEICKKTNADTYINLSGGRKLYHSEDFEIEGMKLLFIDININDIIYAQNSKQFVPNLSIIDVLMNNSISEIKLLLKKYSLNSQ